MVEVFDGNVDMSKKKKSEAKKKKKGDLEFSNTIVASLKQIKKDKDNNTKTLEMMKLFEAIHETEDYQLNQKAKLKLSKEVLKFLKEITEEKYLSLSFKEKVDEYILSFLEIPQVTSKTILERIKQDYENFIQVHGFQGRGDVFKSIKKSLESIFMSDENTKQLLSTLPEEQIPTPF
mmetsp:Transcript_33264/g.30207  ORF Transcript_33264/g.30207 Transcript_33264/m.30207 type:complete len:177 (-) Transcript_33264:1111-1641(-)